MLDPSDIEAVTVIERLDDATWRHELYATVDREQGSTLPVTQAYDVAARNAVATAVQLGQAVDLLLHDGREDLVRPLASHRDMPDDVLFRLCDEGLCIGELGHRPGPRTLLERVIEMYGYREAILTVGLGLYRDRAVAVDELETFLERHREDEWLLRSLAEVEPDDDGKEVVYEQYVTAYPDAAAYHARLLARSPHRNAEQLEQFLAANPDPFVLVLVLGCDSIRPDAAVVIEETAAKHAAVGVSDALHARRCRADARRADLTEHDAARLFDADDPDVLVELASNPRTPRHILEALVERRDAPSARRVRVAAQATLRHLDTGR